MAVAPHLAEVARVAEVRRLVAEELREAALRLAEVRHQEEELPQGHLQHITENRPCACALTCG